MTICCFLSACDWLQKKKLRYHRETACQLRTSFSARYWS